MSGSGRWMSPQLSLMGQAGGGEPDPEVANHHGISSLMGNVPHTSVSQPRQPSSAGGAGESHNAFLSRLMHWEMSFTTFWWM